MIMESKVVFIGAGNMAEAIVSGMVAANFCARCGQYGGSDCQRHGGGKFLRAGKNHHDGCPSGATGRA